MRKLLFIFVMCVLAGGAYGEDASVIPEKNLRLSQNQGFGFTEDTHYDPLVGSGLGAEYAPSHWLNMQLLWNPIFKINPDIRGGSLYFGLKNYIVGNGALVDMAQWLRLSVALGILIPPFDKNPDLRDQDQNLWGSSLRLYSDFVFSRYFYINLYAEGVFYPPQYVNNDVFYGDWARHYLDLTGEMEAHFEIPLNNGAVLKGGAPIRFFYAPYMNADDEYADSQYLLSAGGYFGVSLPAYHPPVEICLRYNAHIRGLNTKQVHQVSVISKVTLPPEALKFRLKRN
jgi:hypothetical protein